MGSCVFFLSMEGEMMYWGGDYQCVVPLMIQKRAVQINATTIKHAAVPMPVTKQTAGKTDDLILDFKIIAGAPLRSKCVVQLSISNLLLR